MLVCDVGFLAWADGILFVVHCFFKCAAHFFYDGMLGTWLCSFISKICYRARCLRAQVMSNVVVAFWMWGGAWHWWRLSISFFLFLICGAFLLCVCVCLCVLNVCAARHVVLLWVRWFFVGLDVNHRLHLWPFFCQLASFCLWCHIWYLVGCVQKVSW